MLSLLSAVIGQSREGLAVALATEALAALCRADVRSVYTCVQYVIIYKLSNNYLHV